MFVTPAWLVRHAVAAVLVLAFLALGWWQIGRAVGGNVLSYAYAVEWPVFAGFVVFVWWKEVRRARAVADHPGRTRPADDELPPLRSTRPRGSERDDGSDDPQLAAYNRYLAWLAANPTARPAQYDER